MTLRFRLLVLVAGVAFFAATGVASVALWREMVQAQNALACEGSAVASSVAASAGRWFNEDGPAIQAREALVPSLERTLQAAPLVRAWVVDRKGSLVACVDKSGAGCPAGAPSNFRPPERPLDALMRLVRREPIEASAPIVHGADVAGAVRVSYRPDGALAAARRLATSAALVAGVFIALGLLFGMILVRRFTQPLLDLSRAAEALPDRFDLKLARHSDHEVNDLIAAFQRMSERLREGREQMQRLIDSLNQRVAAATEEGLRAERLATLGAISAGFAHEMGNSLHVITGFSAVVLRELPPEHPNRADLESVRREAARASALLERFLFFARARTAHGATQSLVPVVREAVEVIGPAAAEGHVVTELSIDPELPAVSVEPELLRQAFLNLCVNAVQAMDARGGGKLSVRAVRRDGGVAVEFSDTGPGVDPAVREHIFEPFFTTKANGTGLGLAMVRQAAEAHGGSVEVESQPGKGALFRVILPAAKPSGEQRA